MTNFTTWIESRQFERLIPSEILAQVPAIKEKARQLTQAYNIDKTSVPPYTEFGKFHDPVFPEGQIIILFLTSEEWQRKGLPRGQGVTSTKATPNRFVCYQIPMTNYDTIYHELVHLFDPKLTKGISKPQRVNGVQNNLTSHETEAQMAGFIDQMREKLNQANPETRIQLVNELKNWLRFQKTDSNTEPWNLPKLLLGSTVWHLLNDPITRRKFLSSVYNALPQ